MYGLYIVTTAQKCLMHETVAELLALYYLSKALWKFSVKQKFSKR